MVSWRVGGAGWGRVSADVNINTEATGRSTRRFFHVRVAEIDRQIAAEAARLAPVRTGHLAASIRPDPVVTRGRFTVGGGVTAHARYAHHVHDGTRPHLIVARRAQALHFFWRREGRWVFFDHVNHPGTRPNPFLRDAARNVMARRRLR